MPTTSIRTIVAMLAVTFVVSACAGLPRTAADQGNDMQTSRDQAKWVAGIDSTQD